MRARARGSRGSRGRCRGRSRRLERALGERRWEVRSRGEFRPVISLIRIEDGRGKALTLSVDPH